MNEQHREDAEKIDHINLDRVLGSFAIAKVAEIIQNINNHRLLKQGGQWQLDEEENWIVGPPRYDSDGIRDSTFDS